MNDELKEVLEIFKNYIVGHHNANAWWNDSSAYRAMKWIENFERRHSKCVECVYDARNPNVCERCGTLR